MGRSSGTPKTELLATSRIIKAIAASEGLYTSEWVRKVIIIELKRSKLLTTSINHPILEETNFTIT